MRRQKIPKKIEKIVLAALHIINKWSFPTADMLNKLTVEKVK